MKATRPYFNKTVVELEALCDASKRDPKILQALQAELREILVKLLIKVAKAGVADPDIYVITPFRIVAEELRRRLEKETKLFAELGVDQKEWIKNRVGTVHTFQGKEAETVIVVLGAPHAAQGGARNWATSIPNLLNVTVSRAKQNLYVVGSHSAWSSVGHGRELARSLPKINV